MMNKTMLKANSQDIEDFKDRNFKHNTSKFEYDLYHDEDNISESIIRIKRFDLPNSGEKWKIFENEIEKFVIEGSKLNKKQRVFLRSINGMNFMINLFKNGIRSFNFFKIQLKNELK